MRKPDPNELVREAQRISALPEEPKRVGFGKQPIPPRPELRSAPTHEDTKVGVAPPPGGSYAPAPAPPPESGSARVRVGDVDLKIGKPFLSKLRGWIAPLLVTAGLSLVGLVVGYYQGLRAAGARMRAAEARTTELAGELAELRAINDTKIRNLAAGLAREGVLTSDHDSRLPRAEARIELLEQRVTDLSKQRAIIVKPQ